MKRKWIEFGIAKVSTFAVFMVALRTSLIQQTNFYFLKLDVKVNPGFHFGHIFWTHRRYQYYWKQKRGTIAQISTIGKISFITTILQLSCPSERVTMVYCRNILGKPWLGTCRYRMSTYRVTFSRLGMVAIKQISAKPVLQYVSRLFPFNTYDTGPKQLKYCTERSTHYSMSLRI